MANANGGAIIYGIKEDEGDRRKPGSLDPINPNEFSKEWLENVIHSNIKPIIQGITIHSIDFKEGVIYVVEIPQSTTAHQAKDYIYYRRRNFKCEPMEDYEIRDILNRNTYPELELYFEIERRYIIPNKTYNNTSAEFNTPFELLPRRSLSYEEVGEEDAILTIYIKNVGTKKAQHVNYKILLPYGVIKNEDSFEIKNDKILVTGNNLITHPHHTFYKPILRNTTSYIEQIYIKKEAVGLLFDFEYQINADDAPERSMTEKWNLLSITKSEREAKSIPDLTLSMSIDPIR